MFLPALPDNWYLTNQNLTGGFSFPYQISSVFISSWQTGERQGMETQAENSTPSQRKSQLLLPQLSYAIKTQLKATKAPYKGNFLPFAVT